MNEDAHRRKTVDGWHIYCARCGDVIGVWPDRLRNSTERDNIHPLIRCKGKGNHERPSERRIRMHWGIVEEFFFYYPETDTAERAYRYVGPPRWPILAAALFILVKRSPQERFKKIRVAGKVVLWLPHRWVFWKKLQKIFAAPANERRDLH